MTIIIKNNGFTAYKIQEMIWKFEKAVELFFPDCTIYHFYYGDILDMADIKLYNGHYANFNISENSVSLCGYTCSNEEYKQFESIEKERKQNED